MWLRCTAQRSALQPAEAERATAACLACRKEATSIVLPAASHRHARRQSPPVARNAPAVRCDRNILQARCSRRKRHRQTALTARRRTPARNLALREPVRQRVMTRALRALQILMPVTALRTRSTIDRIRVSASHPYASCIAELRAWGGRTHVPYWRA